MSIYRHTESALIHGGNTIDPLTGAVNIPIIRPQLFSRERWDCTRNGSTPAPETQPGLRWNG